MKGAISWRVARSVILIAGVACAPGVESARESAATRSPAPWFEGDFETGDLAGWSPDQARQESIDVVARPVRAGHRAARLTLAPGDLAAMKERVELRIEDRDLERIHAGAGRQAWYAWSLLIPEEFADPAPGQFQIVAQWHHRPTPGAGQKSSVVAGPPPLVLHLEARAGSSELVLLGRTSAKRVPRVLGERKIEKGVWIDLLFRVRWSLGEDGQVEAWVDSRPLTTGTVPGRNLYNGAGNYLRLGLYRRQGDETTNLLYVDEVRLGPTRASVVP